jgi:hypothetical protein
MRVMNGVFNIVGDFIRNHFSGDNTDAKRKAMNAYYDKQLEISKQYKTYVPAKQVNIESNINVSRGQPMGAVDLTEEKIKEGTSCLPCSRDHINTASSLLDEASRFAVREKGMNDPEVIKRLDKALRELNAMERIDLEPEYVDSLRGDEKQLAMNILRESAELRHGITNAKSAEDLMSVSKRAGDLSRDLFAKVLEIKTSDEVTEDLCRGLSGSKLENCERLLNPVVQK